MQAFGKTIDRQIQEMTRTNEAQYFVLQKHSARVDSTEFDKRKVSERIKAPNPHAAAFDRMLAKVWYLYETIPSFISVELNQIFLQRLEGFPQVAGKSNLQEKVAQEKLTTVTKEPIIKGDMRLYLQLSAAGLVTIALAVAYEAFRG